ncbi:MAG: class I SAM-dependent methyltransferase [Pseudomonadota bacterium]
MQIIDEKFEEYASNHSSDIDVLLKDLEKETLVTMTGTKMLTGKVAGKFLHSIVKISKAKHALEIGMYTGYSALSIASALPDDGTLITCEINTVAQKLAQKYFKQSPHGKKIKIEMGLAIETIPKIKHKLDFIFIDGDKKNYPVYFDMLLAKLNSGGIMIFDNAFWSGNVLAPNDEESLAIHNLNKKLCKSSNVDNILLTIRDGMQLVIKRS